MSDKLKKAETLFLAIGTVDDRFVAEAMEYRRRRNSWFYTAVAVAASLIIVIGIFSGSIISRLYDAMSLPAEERAHLSLQQTLDKAEVGVTKIAEKDINLFDGDTHIIWQEDGDDGYYTVKVSDKYDATRLNNSISASAVKAEVGGTKKLWICFGDGTVITPYLKESAGNVGYGELFDYSPEVYPDEEFSALVKDLVSQKA